MRLRTFGGLWIEGGPPRPLGPRRMALLAFVAAGATRGVRRERVLATFWPDADEQHARHALSQTLYSLRRETGHDWIVPAAELRLGPAVTSDIGDLHTALAAENADAACAIRCAEFLEGFFLPDAPDFERWVEEERARIRAAVARVSERALERAGEGAAALPIWERLTELDPLSSRWAAGRMRALIAAEDRAGALAHARRHADLVRQELEADVDPAISALAAKARATPTPSQAPDAVRVPESAPPLAEAPAIEDRRPPRRRRRALAMLVSVAALLAVAAAAVRSAHRPELPARTIAGLRTTSPEAYLLYNEGLRAYYALDVPGAQRMMDAALEWDSTFAMAAFYAWVIGEPLVDGPEGRRNIERVRRLAPRTIERERLLLQAEVARREAPIGVAAAIAETLTVRYPDDPDGHILLGQIRFNLGSYGAAVAAYQRAIALDSAPAAGVAAFCRACVALGAMAHVYLWWDSAAASERVGRRLVALRPGEPAPMLGLVEPLLRQGRRAEAEAALELGSVLNLQPDFESYSLHRDLIRWGRHDELDQRLAPQLRSSSPVVRSTARWFLLLSLRDRGRLREARALALNGVLPGTGERIRGVEPELVLSATLLQGLGRPDSAAKLLHAGARRILEDRDIASGPRARNATWRLTLAGTAYAQAGDTATVRRLADSIELIGRESSFGRDTRLHHYLRGLVLQGGGRHAEAADQFRRAIHSLTDGYSEINLALARSLVALGRPAEAVAVLRPALHGGVDGSNTYTSRTEVREAMAAAFERSGEIDSAAVHRAAADAAWERADPEVRRRVEHGAN